MADLPNVSVFGYNTSGVDEMATRQIARETQRSVGFETIRRVWGFPQHSVPLLHDIELHHKIQVNLAYALQPMPLCNCDQVDIQLQR